MQVKGYAALILTFSVVLLLVSSLGIAGSIRSSIDPQILSIIFAMGLVILLAMVLRKHTEM